VFSGGKHGQGYLAFPERIGRHAESLGSVYTSVLIQNTVILKVLLLLLIIMFVTVVIKQKYYKEKYFREFLYLLLFPVVIFVFYLFYAYPVFPEYILGLTIPVCLAMLFLFKFLWKMNYGKVVLLLFFFVTLLQAVTLIAKPYVHDETSGSYSNQKAVAEWITNDSKGQNFGYFVYGPSTYTYGMDYLLWWEAKSQGKVKPESKKNPVTYLILYPALEHDGGAHSFWKNHKIRTKAKIIGKREFKCGIIVEKLQIGPGELPVDPTYYQNLIFR
jgi:hypothetical protein